MIDLENEFVELLMWMWFLCGFMKFCYENWIFVVFYFVDCSFGKCYFSVFFGEDIDYCDVIKLGYDFEYGDFMWFSGGNGYCCKIGFFDGDILSIFSEVMRKINLFWEMGLFV